MLPEALKSDLQAKVARVDHPREMAIDVIYALQDHYGYFSDEALAQAVDLLGMSPWKWMSWRRSTPLSTASRWVGTSSTCATA
jgi:NADH:ubiquinone oxidoreductase subunit E